MSKITLAGGCFWCVEALLKQVKGVTKTQCGYAGGHTPYPTYEAVCTGETGHAEVVQVDFDETQLPLPTLLAVFFALHDPTSLNRQGADEGTQYRSAVFYHDLKQQAVVEHAIADPLTSSEHPVVTEVAPLMGFYPAEEKHQNYFYHHPNSMYCQVHIGEKWHRLSKAHPDWFKSEAFVL